MGDEREPTMEVEVGELKDAATKDAASEGRRESTLDAVLGELEDELEYLSQFLRPGQKG